MNLGNKIRDRRKNLGLTLKEVSASVGVAEATVQRWESGNIKIIKSDKMKKLASVLQVSIYELSNWISDCDKPSEADFQEWEQQYNADGKLARKMNLLEEIQKQHGKAASEAFSLYTRLDTDDQGEIRGEMKQMLKSEKYFLNEEPVLNAAHAIEGASEEDIRHDEDIMNAEDF